MTARALPLLYTLILATNLHLLAQTQLGDTIEDADSLARIGTNLDLSADGLRLLAGAPNASEVDFLAGKVKVFDFVDGDWMQVGQDLLGTLEGDYFGTELSMSASGSRFVLGYRNQNDLDLSRTLVAYEWQDEQWDTIGQVITLAPGNYYTGSSVQMSNDGNRIAAFVTFIDEELEPQSAVQAFEWLGNEWAPFGPPILEPSGHRFRGEMILSGDGQTIAVNGQSISNFWRFLTYRFTDGQWLPLGQLVSSSENNDQFAWSLSLSDDGQRIAVGAPKANAEGADSGNVIVYELIDGQWTPLGNNIPGENVLDQTGFDVALSGDGQRLVVGDHYYDEPEFNSGRIRVFQWLEDDWMQIGNEVIGEDRADFFGQKVAISQDGSTVAAGAPQGGGDTDTNGQIKVFGDYPWVPILRTTEPTKRVNVYPNPMQDDLFIDAPLGSAWQLLDVLGRPVRSGILEARSIDLQSLRSGMYFLQIQVNHQWGSAQIIKQ